MLSAVDRFVGKHVYVPIVILLCQRTGLTQYAVYRYALMAGTWMLLLRSSGGPAIWSWFVGALALAMTIIAGMVPDTPQEPSSRWWRIAWISVEALHWLDHAIGGTGHDFAVVCAMGQAYILAEYALTVRTIPPRETRKRLTAVKPARAEG